MTTLTKNIIIALITLASTIMAAHATQPDDFVRVKDGKFQLNGKPYCYVGTNMWYASILGSTGRGGNRDKLCRELDHLHSLGIDNLRILVGADGDENLTSHVMPVLQTAPGVYNDTIMQGLDFVLTQLELRGMKAVLYLNNSWEWSGGYSAYLQWAGLGKALIPRVDGYKQYVDYVKEFVFNSRAKELFYNHVKTIVSRRNSITGKLYSESPAIMAWQIGNEPRAFSRQGLAEFTQYIITAAHIIKSIDKNHLVSTGSEGLMGCEYNLDCWRNIHSADVIDYANIHIWPATWRWIKRDEMFTNVEKACSASADYVARHYEAIQPFGKPLVLEEFGYHRDDFSFTPGSPTQARDKYYTFITNLMLNGNMIAGCNFWAWSGSAKPAHLWWEPWDDYTGDPAQEEQGLYSVFATDSSTLRVLQQAAQQANAMCK
ncbi:MAG: beta-mannosidase [Muribaculaceae bacterium]